MVLLGLIPVLEAMVSLILIQVKTGESLRPTPVTHAVNISKEVVFEQALTHSNKREKKELQCKLGYYPHPSGSHCCLKCHKGTYVFQHCSSEDKAPNCTECPQNTYMPNQNSLEKCLGCERCHLGFGQIVISNCTYEQNTVCGCGKNQYRDGFNERFFCKDCSTCRNGIIAHKCTESHDTICTCYPGYFLYKNNCFPCSNCSGEECKKEECKGLVGSVKTPPQSYEMTSILVVIVVLLGTGCAFLLAMRITKQSYLKRFCSDPCFYSPGQQPTTESASKMTEKANNCLPDSIKINLLPQTPTVLVEALPYMQTLGDKRIPDSPDVLYTVVDHIPFSRWKEFMRRLELNENAIERIFMEQRTGRDAQYEMLKQWRLQAGYNATVERITTVLSLMELNGCSEAIQEALTKRL